MLVRISTGIVAIGVALAGMSLWRITPMHPIWAGRLRWFVAVLTAFSAASFIFVAVSGTTVRDALRDNTSFQRPPYALQGTLVAGFVILLLGWILSVIRIGVPRFREKSSRPLWYQAIALTTCVALLITSLEIQGLGKKHLDPEARIALLDKSLRALEEGDREMPRDTWDPDYVVNMVGRDPQKLFRWVQQNTYWIPYRGVLRGPVGVLMDRQGNSLDRALLLSAVLERTGQTVRLAHGELSRQDAVDILPEIVSERAAYFSVPEADIAPDIDVRLAASQYGLDRARIAQTLADHLQAADKLSAQLDSRVADQTMRLLQTTSPSDPDQEWVRRFETNVAALRDHWWVQVEDGSRWVDLDPLVGDGSRSVALTAPKETLAPRDLATTLYHQIAFRVVAEQWSAGTVKERTVLEHVIQPANTIGLPIYLQFTPTDWRPDSVPVMHSAADMRKAALLQTEWAAGLVVGREDVASGTLRETAEESTASQGGAFAFGAALEGTLNHGRDTAPRQILTAVWLEYEIMVPDQKPRTIRRAIFDLLGPVLRASGATDFQLDETKRLSRALAMGTKTEILPVVCQFAPDFVSHLTAQAINANQKLLNSIFKPDFSADSETTKQQLAQAMPPVSPLIALAFTRLEWNHAGEHIFIDRPNILTRHQYLTDTSGGIALRNAIDIVANEVGVNLCSPDAFAIRLQQGVRDTNNEALLFSGAATGNTGDAFADSRDWLTIAPVQRASLEILPFSESTRHHMAQELDAGYLLVAPKSSVPRRNEDFVGWWRIDPETGDTLGLAENGWGQAATEDSLQLRMAIEFSRGFVFEYTLCQSFPLALNSIRIINEELFNGWHPSWTPPAAKSQDPVDMADQNMNMCIIQAITMGIVATLPLLLLTLRNSRPIRALRSAQPRRSPPRIPCPEAATMSQFEGRLPLATIFVQPLLALSISGGLPCVQDGGPGLGGGLGRGGAGSGGGARGGANSSGGGNGSGPKGPKGPPEANPPKPKPDDPCDIGEGSGDLGPPTDPYPNTFQQLQQNLENAKAAEDQARNEWMKAVQDLLAQRVNKPNLVFKTGGDPAKFDQVAFDNATKAKERAWKNLMDKEAARIEAQEAYDAAEKELNELNGAGGARQGSGGAGGQCGGAGQSGGGSQLPQNASPNAPQSGTGPAQQVGGNPPPNPGSQIPESPAPDITDPNGPPTVRDPGAESPGPPAISDPYSSPAHAPTQPQFPPLHQFNVNDAGPRNPTLPAQKGLAGAAGALGAFGGE